MALSWFSGQHLTRLINSSPSTSLNFSCFLALFIKVFNFFQASLSGNEIIPGLNSSVSETHSSFKHLSSGIVVVIMLITGFLVL